MKKIAFLFLVILATPFCFNSCGGGEESATKEDSPKIDSVTYSPEIKALMERFPLKDALPYKFDSLGISASINGDTLTIDEVKLLSDSIYEDMNGYQAGWCIKFFYELDSVRELGRMEEHLEHADLGDIVHAQAYVVQRMVLDSNLVVLFWSLDNHSYEACPYSFGTEIYMTILSQGKIAGCFCLAEISGGADAPMVGNTSTYATVHRDGKILITCTQESTDLDVQSEFETSHFEYQLRANGQLIKVSEKKDPVKIIVFEQDEIPLTGEE